VSARRAARLGRVPDLGLELEILISFALILLTASAVMGGVLLRSQLGAAESLRALAAGSLVAEVESGAAGLSEASPLEWWRLLPSGDSQRLRGESAAPDAALVALGLEARRLGRPLLAGDGVVRDLRFAAPALPTGDVLLARLPGASSQSGFLLLLGVDALVFTAFGAGLLRRRVVAPLRRLAEAAERVAAGGLETRVLAEGPAELAQLAGSFNAMTASLAAREAELEKAVAELRASNRSLREARRGLERAERLAAVGSLAAGVAHEVGNPMGALLAFLDLAGRGAGIDALAREHLARASREGERVRRILRQLLDFSRPPRNAPERLELARVADEVCALLRAQRRELPLELGVEVAPGAPDARADRALVSQILFNLVHNAVDAAGARAGGSVRLRVEPAWLERRAGEPPGAALPGRPPDAVACRVEDNGPGVPEALRERIFDPFFTTKDPGQGTGLGLANALRFAAECGGSLELLPSAQGACFWLVLPAQDATDGDTARGAARRA